MLWREAIQAASPHPATRRDADGSTWVVYLDGSVDRRRPDGRHRRMRRVRPDAWVDWQPEGTPCAAWRPDEPGG